MVYSPFKRFPVKNWYPQFAFDNPVLVARHVPGDATHVVVSTIGLKDAQKLKAFLYEKKISRTITKKRARNSR
jgi:hypothetical protein